MAKSEHLLVYDINVWVVAIYEFAVLPYHSLAVAVHCTPVSQYAVIFATSSINPHSLLDAAWLVACFLTKATYFQSPLPSA